MENIIQIYGNVKFTITLDPSVWIFDDRKAELHTFFDEGTTDNNQLEEYTKSISKHWDREIIEGAAIPVQEKTNSRKFLKETLLTGTFGISFHPFLQNSEPNNEAKEIVIETREQNYSFPLAKGNELVLCFSDNGKPLREDGPVHLYFKDGSNKDLPIKNVTGFKIE